jgi:hypothetical protein
VCALKLGHRVAEIGDGEHEMIDDGHVR